MKWLSSSVSGGSVLQVGMQSHSQVSEDPVKEVQIVYRLFLVIARGAIWGKTGKTEVLP